MYQKIIIIIILFVLFVLFGLFAYTEGFNNEYPESNYTPNTELQFPMALDGKTTYVSPDSKGNCPEGMKRDINDIDSLCNGGCDQGKFYKADDIVYGCMLLNKDYPQIKYPKYILADDKKTYYVSPTIDARCPKLFNLDTKTGLCHTKCGEKEQFYGTLGCSLLNTNYSQGQYDGSNNPYLYAEDNITQFVSPTSTAVCPKGFVLDYSSGLCHTKCPSGKKFNSETSGSSIIGCN